MDFIRYYQGRNTGLIRPEEIKTVLENFKKVGQKVLKRENCQHVIYASKKFDADGNLVSIQFYNPPVICSDAELEEKLQLTDYQLYTLHARK